LRCIFGKIFEYSFKAIETGHDGRSAAMTAPNGLAQQELIKRCLAQIDVEKKKKLHFWECHGTGTALGDPVEYLALARALSHEKMPSQIFAGTAVDLN
jgi:acyl transferase domain-containing protein